jgi:hypothetical protein
MRFRPLALGLALAVTAVAAIVVATGGGDGDAKTTSVKLPPAKATWHYQLQGKVRPSAARVNDVDGFDTPASFAAHLRARGGYSICYVNAGAWENWRPDRHRFPEAVLGRPNGWPGERWLDIRRLDVIGPIMRDRLKRCRSKGFDAVEPDNVDGYANRSGFALSAGDQLTYNRFLARTARRLGLAVGLKNDLVQAKALEPRFDFAVVEQCFAYDECDLARPFTRVRKAVFEVEYDLPRSKFCGAARRLRLNAIRADQDLAGATRPCS